MLYAHTPIHRHGAPFLSFCHTAQARGSAIATLHPSGVREPLPSSSSIAIVVRPPAISIFSGLWARHTTATPLQPTIDYRPYVQPRPPRRRRRRPAENRPHFTLFALTKYTNIKRTHTTSPNPYAGPARYNIRSGPTPLCSLLLRN